MERQERREKKQVEGKSEGKQEIQEERKAYTGTKRGEIHFGHPLLTKLDPTRRKGEKKVKKGKYQGKARDTTSKEDIRKYNKKRSNIRIPLQLKEILTVRKVKK